MKNNQNKENIENFAIEPINLLNNNINNINSNQNKTTTTNEKDALNIFSNGTLVDKNNNQNIQILSTEEQEIINQNFPENNIGGVNTEYNNNYDIINQENSNLRRQIMELEAENQNLQIQINNQENYPLLNNNINPTNNRNSQNSFFNNKSEQIMKIENDNFINLNNAINNNIINAPYKNQKFVQDSIETIIKTNMILGSNKKNNSNKKINIKNYNSHTSSYTLKNNPNYNISSYEPKTTSNNNNNNNSNFSSFFYLRKRFRDTHYY